MTRRSSLLLFLAAVFVSIAVQKSYAAWVEHQLTPRNAVGDWISFAVKTKDVEGLKQFDVTVEMKKRKISPVLTARVDVFDGKTRIASVPVDGVRKDGKVTYWFRIAPRLITHSKFEFGEHGHALEKDVQGGPVTDEWGRVKYIGVPGGSGYWFYLGDFADAG